MAIEDYERKDYANLAKEFGCIFRIGKHGIKFLSKDPSGKVYKLISVIPLDGWYTDPKAVEHIIRENGTMTSPSVNDQEQKPSGLEELREEIIKLIDDGPINVLHLSTCLCIQHEDIPELPDTCSCGAENNVVEAITSLFHFHMQAERKQTASDIFSLAHEYAQEDKTMVGSEELRSYHYLNAISKIGEFGGR